MLQEDVAKAIKKQKMCAKSLCASVDQLVAHLEKTREQLEIENVGSAECRHSSSGGDAEQSQTHECWKALADKVGHDKLNEKINATFKTFHATISKMGKSLERRFTSDSLPSISWDIEAVRRRL
jgi:hypothetical protein